MSEPQQARDLVRWDVVEEHLDEAEFLLVQWEAGLDSPAYRLDDLANTVEQRLLVHVDALAVGGAPVAEALLWPALDAKADARPLATVAGLALLREADPHGVDRILAHLVALPPGPAFDGLAAALCLTPRTDVASRVFTRVEHGAVEDRSKLLVAIAARGGTPGTAAQAWLETAVRDEDVAVRRGAARLALHCPRAVALRAAERLIGDADPEVCIAALEAAFVHGSPGAHAVAIEFARGARPADPAVVRAALLAISLTGESVHLELARARLADADVRADAVWALGFGGRPAAVELLLPLLGDAKLGPLAAEAILGITGIGRDDPRCWVEGAPQPEVTDAEIQGDLPPEDLDADPSGAVEDELPVPIAERFVAAWATTRDRMDPRQRFGEGRPLVHASTYAELLAGATMRRRHAIALEIALRTRGVVRVPTRVFSSATRPHLGVLAAAGAIDGNRPFARIS